MPKRTPPITKGSTTSRNLGLASLDTYYVDTYPVAVNVTLALDEAVVERAREVARQQGTSLNALIREYVEHLAGQRDAAELAREFKRLWDEGSGRSDGRRFRREELYEVRLGRSRLR